MHAADARQMGRAEGLLVSQAHTLDAIFVNMMRRARKQTSMPHWDACMGMGMKAQSCIRSASADFPFALNLCDFGGAVAVAHERILVLEETDRAGQAFSGSCAPI